MILTLILLSGCVSFSSDNHVLDSQLKSLHDLMFGKTYVTQWEEHVMQTQQNRKRMHEVAELSLREKFHKAAKKRMEQLAKRKQTQKFSVGDLVVELPNQRAPLQTNVKGPFRIIEINEMGTTCSPTNRSHTKHTSKNVQKTYITFSSIQRYSHIQLTGEGGGRTQQQLHTSSLASVRRRDYCDT